MPLTSRYYFLHECWPHFLPNAEFIFKSDNYINYFTSSYSFINLLLFGLVKLLKYLLVFYSGCVNGCCCCVTGTCCCVTGTCCCVTGTCCCIKSGINELQKEARIKTTNIKLATGKIILYYL